jgi:hypothetical protein
MIDYGKSGGFDANNSSSMQSIMGAIDALLGIAGKSAKGGLPVAKQAAPGYNPTAASGAPGQPTSPTLGQLFSVLGTTESR